MASKALNVPFDQRSITKPQCMTPKSNVPDNEPIRSFAIIDAALYLEKKKEYEAGHNPTRYTRHTQAQSPIDYSLQHMLLLVLNFSRFFVVVNSPFSNKFKFMFFFHAKQRQWKELRTKERAMRKRCRKRFLWQLRRIRVNKKGKVTKKKRAKGKRPSSRTDHISWQRWPLALSLCCTQASPSTRRRNIICYMLGMCVSLRACSWHTQQFVLSTK